MTEGIIKEKPACNGLLEIMLNVNSSIAVVISKDRKIIFANELAREYIRDINCECYKAIYRRSSPCQGCPLDNGGNTEIITDFVNIRETGTVYERTRAPLMAGEEYLGLIEIIKMPQGPECIVAHNNAGGGRRSEMRDVLMNIIPVLSSKVHTSDMNTVIKDIGDRMEIHMESMLECCRANNEPSIKCACHTMNEMGSNFTATDMGGHVEITGTRCPWGEDAISNPFLCNITRMVFSRALKHDGMHVDLIESIGNRDARCLLRAYKK